MVSKSEYDTACFNLKTCKGDGESDTIASEWRERWASDKKTYEEENQ